ncbi:MAG: DMT family transporter [Alphaproteobacteria bacterium]
MSATAARPGADPAALAPAVAAALTGIQVGAAMVATRFAVDAVGPGSLALLRYVIAVLCLAPFVLLARHRTIRRADVLPIALLGIGQFGVLIALLNYGLQTVPAARAALLFATFPLMTMLVAAALGREPLTRAKSTGVALTFLGVAVALGEKLTATGGGAWIGEAAVLASALVGGICTALYRPYLARNPALPVGALAMLASVLALALLAAAEGFFSMPPTPDPTQSAAILFIGLSSGVFYVVWLWALGRASPTRVAAFLSLSPIAAAILGAILLDEPVGLAAVAGLAIVVAGLVAAHR